MAQSAGLPAPSSLVHSRYWLSTYIHHLCSPIPEFTPPRLPSTQMRPVLTGAHAP